MVFLIHTELRCTVNHTSDLRVKQFGENTISQDENYKIFKYVIPAYVILLNLTTYNWHISKYFFNGKLETDGEESFFFLKTVTVADIIP